MVWTSNDVNYIVMASLTAPIIMELVETGGFVIPILAAHMFVFITLADDTQFVGMAAYAAAAIAKSDPIVAVHSSLAYLSEQRFYRFMFFFNNELLLISSVDRNDPNDASAWVWITNFF